MSGDDRAHRPPGDAGYPDLDATEVGAGRAGYRQDTTELGDARRRVQSLVCDLPGADRPFAEPWELRAFAIAVAAYHEGHYGWSEFQLSLIDSIRRWEQGSGGEPWSYYEHWLEALETVLASTGAMSDPLALDDRTRQVLATPSGADHHQARREPVAVSPATTSPPPSTSPAPAAR